MKTRSGLFALTLAGALAVPASAPRAQEPPPTSAGEAALAPTVHPRLPADLSLLWLAPESPTRVGRSSTGPGQTAAARAAASTLASAVKLEVDGNFAKALPILSQPGIQAGSLGHYAEYYRGLAELRLGRPADARQTFRSLAAKAPIGYLVEAAALREAECDEALDDRAAAIAIYDRLSQTKTTAPDDILMRLGKAAKAAGNAEQAAAAYSRVVYEFPFSALAADAGAALDGLPLAPIVAGSHRYKLEIGRAERLFGAKRYAPARAAFEPLRHLAQGDDRELIHMRLAECDYYLKKPRNTRDGLKPYIESASRRAEALYFYAVAIRELGDRAEYMTIVRRLVDEFPSESWAEEALNNLATHYIVEDDDEQADATFREMYSRYPTGHYAERAAWKIGWRAYKNGRYADTVRAFESAATNFPRSDYRPPWLYWSGRAHAALNQPALATAHYTLVATDYLNSYYGRLAVAQLGGQAPQRRLVGHAGAAGRTGGGADDGVPVPPLPPNAAVVRALLGIELYDQALDELHYAQKVWGDSSGIAATLAWIYEAQGRTETGERQFSLYRSAINTMKRAYPQFLAAGGEELPAELLRIIFPIGYWDLIRKHAVEYNLDPYLVAALMAQESTFVPDIVSYAKAVGLMQLEAATAREYARKLGIRYSSKLLTNPDASIRIGMAKLADDLKRFGEMHLVLASYNAGPGAVRRWIDDRPGLARDEFIDDIPYPQTQGYVKKILGTAEDYRRLYGSEAAVADTAPSSGATAKTAASRKTPTKTRRRAVVKKARKAA
jgi:soluble lytic murein transglycosylase